MATENLFTPDCIRTHSGLYVNVFDPKPDMFKIEDVGHALSMQCRFGGHLPHFYCPTLDQRILTADLDWVFAEDLKCGDKLIAFDEYPVEPGAFGKKRRKIKPSVVTHSQQIKREIVTLKLSDGSIIKSSHEHKWLIATKISRNQTWCTAYDIYIAIKNGRKRYMHKFLDVWKFNNTYNSGWLSGMADGEGHLVYENRRGVNLGICQNKGNTLDKIIKTCTELGFNTTLNKSASKTAFVVDLLGGWTEILKFMGVVKPMRLIEKFKNALFDNSFCKQMNGCGTPLLIVDAKLEGTGWVAGIETSTHTYFCEGFGAHNSVAQHCLEVCNMVPDEHKLDALMHDASEAYLMDFPRPIKQRISDYKRIENNLMQTLAQVFDFSWPMPDIVKEADEKQLVDEWENIFLTTKQPVLSQQEAKTCFINKYYQLKEIQKNTSFTPEEVLNLDHHIKRLLLKALNKFKFKTQAHAALGITEKHMYNLIKQYNVKLIKGKYIIPSEPVPNGKSNQPVS